ncbi:DUF4258 domain-containing protein [Candidatus Saganbacteria bacterium]|nr:DUF4258 domain-containing protein [Candidatus Saganbacteria bacterium]
MANLHFTKHARIRMKERRISEKEVEVTVLNPSKWHYGHEGEIVAIRKSGKKESRVVYFSEPQFIKIITVMK